MAPKRKRSYPRRGQLQLKSKKACAASTSKVGTALFIKKEKKRNPRWKALVYLYIFPGVGEVRVGIQVLPSLVCRVRHASPSLLCRVLSIKHPVPKNQTPHKLEMIRAPQVEEHESREVVKMLASLTLTSLLSPPVLFVLDVVF